MAIGPGESSINLNDILQKTTEADILLFYLGIDKIPCVIRSPLRQDKKPSFGLYSPDGKRIFYKDFSTGENGGIFDLLSNMWNISYIKVLEKISDDIPQIISKLSIEPYIFKNINSLDNYNSIVELQCKTREWRKYDLDYWKSFGIDLKWLKYAEVYPISHKIITKNNQRYIFSADKYAYVYVEHKDGKVTLKIYQPFNKDGYKWSNKHDSSVISLWTKIPEYGDTVCICSSLKDALCLWANTDIPSLAVQGEGYNISNTAISELKRRYNRICILFDNDKAGIMDGRKLSSLTGFINIVLPEFHEGKDISDLYHSLHDKKEFKKIITGLFIKNH